MKKIEIKNRYNDKIIISGKYESIKDCLEKNRTVNLRNANLRDADLWNANLRNANLRNANLRHANLSNADLSNANLRNADLRNADLSDAEKYINWLKPYTVNDYIKEFSIKKKGNCIFVYKGVTKDLKSPTYDSKLEYKIGSTITTEYANPNVFMDCGHGIHLCPTKKLAEGWGNTIIEVKVNIGDIVCIPYPITKDKFRVKKCKVIGVVE